MGGESLVSRVAQLYKWIYRNVVKATFATIPWFGLARATLEVKFAEVDLYSSWMKNVCCALDYPRDLSCLSDLTATLQLLIPSKAN